MRILVIEDDMPLANALEVLLRQHDFEVDVASTAFAAMDVALSNAYNCLVVDVMLPDGNGIDLVQQLRELKCTTPALMLTARNSLTDRVQGLNAGADDYLGKPFDNEELVARVIALLRRSSTVHTFDAVTVGHATLYRNSRTLSYKKQILELSSKEFALLEALMRHPGQVLTRDILIQNVWGPDSEVADNALDTYIYFLRKKCSELGLRNFIRTIRGEGYLCVSEKGIK